MDKKIIEEKAHEVLETVKDTGDAAVEIIRLAQTLGFVVGNAIFHGDEDGFIVVKEGAREIFGQETDKLIGVRADRSTEWKRFIIAHEIGHYILHYNSAESKGLYAHRDHRKGKGPIENEADYFAANLLMPSDRFIKNYDELCNLSREEKILILAKRFNVTRKMVERRFEELKLDEAV